jgi:hypothetical protein
MDRSSTIESLSRTEQKTILLHHINDTPEPPSKNWSQEQSRVIQSDSPQRSVTPREERRLSEAFALLAVSRDDSGRVAAPLQGYQAFHINDGAYKMGGS